MRAAVPPQTWGEIASRRGSLAYDRTVTDYGVDFPRGPVRWFTFRFAGDGRSGSIVDGMDPGPTDFAFHTGVTAQPVAQRSTTVIVPHWAILVAASVLPAGRFVSMFRRRRARKQGTCAACGYDLRASPGRCPECGADNA
jgi:hypothetical protein